MQLEFTPYILPFVVSLVTTIGLALYAMRHYNPAARVFVLVMTSLSIWTFCYIMELSSVSLQDKIMWVQIKYLGSTPGPILWFVFSLYMTNNQHLLKGPLKTIMVAAVLVTWAVVFTHGLQNWMWTDIQLKPGFPETQSGHGFYFWIYAAILYLSIMGSVVVYANFYRTTSRFFKQQALWLLLGGFIPLAGRMTEDVFGMDLIPKVDEVIFFFLFSGIFFALALFRYGALKLVPIAHHLVVKNINAAIVVLDLMGRIVDLNPYAQRILGSEEHAGSIGKTPQEVLGDSLKLATFDQVPQELSLVRGDQESCFSVQYSPIREQRGQVAGHVLVLFDITERKQAEMQLAHIARTDALTQVTNRRYFYELAEPEFQRVKSSEGQLGVVMLDVDYFKKINDTYGHQIGDEVLKHVAKVCKGSLRQTDLFARYGGEEFICLVSGATPEDTQSIAEKLRQALAETPLELPEQKISITASLGVAVLHNAAKSLDELIGKADEALYTSKKEGRNRVTLSTVLGTAEIYT